MQILKSHPEPEDQNSLVTLLQAEISKPLLLGNKDYYLHFANGHRRPSRQHMFRETQNISKNRNQK
jgi:hypothetical protein